MIKEEIKDEMIRNSRKIQNDIVKSSVIYLGKHEPKLVEYLRSIKPLFPRFLSEYMSGTYVGITKSIVGLFQNSKTIRTVFSKRIDVKIKDIIVKSEVQTITSMIGIVDRPNVFKMWDCSSSKSDELRRKSWGTPVYGATVPHPMELMRRHIRQGQPCMDCAKGPPISYYISTLVPHGLGNYKNERGPYKAYLGSKTSETTSLIQPWEKETKIPLIRRAERLRSAIGWFVQKDSLLGRGIIQNLESLTGEDWSNITEGYKRTGSALHRFTCARQSSAGYAAQSPSKFTWMCSTTDTLSTLNSINHDFMHQTLLLYAQTTVSEVMESVNEQGFFHHHISCTKCLRERSTISHWKQR